jgi:hypothetical protein
VPVAVEWGPVGTWARAGATVLVVIVTVLVAFGYFDAFRRPRIHITFESAQPWCRYGTTEHEGKALWVRIGVENRGAAPARGCGGRLIAVTTDGELRHDVDPVQLGGQGSLERGHSTRWTYVATNANTSTCSTRRRSRAGSW